MTVQRDARGRGVSPRPVGSLVPEMPVVEKSEAGRRVRGSVSSVRERDIGKKESILTP